MIQNLNQRKMSKRKQKKLPNNYKEGIPRVSDLVDAKYPFTWTKAEEMFLRWLDKNNVTYDDYMKEATEWGTYIHKQLEKYLRWEDIDDTKKKYTDIIISWIEAIDELDIVPIHIEHYICNDKFQWTIDLVAKVNWKKFILDWKTWNLAKNNFNLNTWKYKKPTSKLKKASLQLSLYAKELWIKNIWVIELDNEWFHFHILKRIKDEELDKILDLWK